MEPSAINCNHVVSMLCSGDSKVVVVTNLLEVLALELSDELVEALGVGIDTDGGEDTLDVGGRGRLVASQGQEEVSGEVLHFDRLSQKLVVSLKSRILKFASSAPALRLMHAGSETHTFLFFV